MFLNHDGVSFMDGTQYQLKQFDIKRYVIRSLTIDQEGMQLLGDYFFISGL